jgi:predicted phosphoribosyltransferase
VLFTDRVDAGQRLASRLISHPVISRADRGDLLVLSIPRGGVVIGDVVAKILGCPHEVIVVKKIGFPGHGELAIGAIAEDEALLLNSAILNQYRFGFADIEPMIYSAKAKVQRYITLFREGRALDVASKIVIMVDDGIATGETMKAAIRWLDARSSQDAPRQIMIAVPVCSHNTARELRLLVDHLVCLETPGNFFAVSQFYLGFEQVDDAEVLSILRQADTIL